MKVARVEVPQTQLFDPDFDGWKRIEARDFPLVPTPLKGNPAIRAVSPFIEKSTDHGAVTNVSVRCAHNGDVLAVRLSWLSDRHDKIVDLDEFVDGVAVMFPLTPRASAVTMGSETDPVNAWYWKGNLDDVAFDVVARGYGTSARRNDDRVPIACRAVHDGKAWHVVMARALVGADDRARFTLAGVARMAFAVWDGGNRERSGRKSFSGDFVPVTIEA